MGSVPFSDDMIGQLLWAWTDATTARAKVLVEAIEQEEEGFVRGKS